MDERLIKLNNNIDKICEYKNELDIIKDNIDLLKMNVVKQMAELGLNKKAGF